MGELSRWREQRLPLGQKPREPFCEARLADPTAVVWKGGEDVPQGSRGIRILGTPLGHSEYVVAQLHTERLALVAVMRNVETVSELFIRV